MTQVAQKTGFDFSDVDTQASGPGQSKFLKLGTDKTKRPNVRVMTITSITSNITKTNEPFIKVIAEDTEGYVVENDFFVNTVVKEGKKTSSFNVSKTDFVKILVVTGLTEDEAKTYLTTATSEEDLANKMATKAIGKPFKLGLYGKIATSSKGEFLKTMWAQGKNNIMFVDTPDAEVNICKSKDETETFFKNIDKKKSGAATDDLSF